MKADLRGRVVLPEDEGYNEARKVYNGMIDKHPKLLVSCVNAADVRVAVEFARENDLVVAVRGGGHNGAGLATCDDGMVIDLSPMIAAAPLPELTALAQVSPSPEPTVRRAQFPMLAETIPISISAVQGQRGLNDWHPETVSSNRDIPEAQRSPHREVGSLLA